MRFLLGFIGWRVQGGRFLYLFFWAGGAGMGTNWFAK